MTLCLAAVADGKKTIVTVSDKRFDLGATSGDALGKGALVAERWMAFFAGNDVARGHAILEKVAAVFEGVPGIDQPTIERAFAVATHETQRGAIEAEVLSPSKYCQ